jgi:hypothetical protein
MSNFSNEAQTWKKTYFSKLNKYQDVHKNEDCFIVGNGPSLNNTDLSLLKNKYVFGLNKIYLIFEKQEFSPTYIAAVNDLVIQQSANRYQELKMPIFLKHESALRHEVTGNHILHTLKSKYPFYFCRQMTDEFSEGYTVTYYALQLAFAMGFQNVFLVGVDHSFKQTGKPNEKQRMQSNDPNHFHPDYFKGHDWQLADLEASELAYKTANFFYTRTKRKIYDATIGGKLNIFPKISYQNALRQCRSIKGF